MKINRELINFVLLLTFTFGLFFSSARLITHNNFPVIDEKHEKFHLHYLGLKEKVYVQKKMLNAEDTCEKIKTRELDRHALRMVFEEARIYYLENVTKFIGGKKSMSFAYSLMLFILITSTFFVSVLTINKKIYKFIIHNKSNYLTLLAIFFLIISFYSFRAVSELRYSFFEMFFISASIFFAYTKRKILFLITVILATLNRESGILISSIWFIFNGLEFRENKLTIKIKETLYSFLFVAICLAILISLNIKFFSCALEFSDMTYATTSVFEGNIITNLNILFTNFFLIIFLFIFFYKKLSDQFSLILLAFFYGTIFIMFTPADHYILRILFAPILLLYSYHFLKNKNE